MQLEMVYGYTLDLSNGVKAALHSVLNNPCDFTMIESLIICRSAAYRGAGETRSGQTNTYGRFKRRKGHHGNERNMMHSLFTLIGDSCLFPRLKTVAIHFDDMELPVSVLTSFLLEAKGLRDLGLIHVTLKGTTTDFEEMEESLKSHTNLEGVQLAHCNCYHQDDEAADDDDKDEDDDGSEMTETKRYTKRIIPARIFCQSRNLQRLWLQDCPDSHVVAVAQSIYQGETNLRELAIVSSHLGDDGAEALSQMLQTQTTLDELRIALFRGHAIRVMESIAAVSPNSNLKKLTCDILVPPNKPLLMTDGPKRI